MKLVFVPRIENRVPIPPPQNHGYTAALRKMKVGQSIVLPVRDTASAGAYGQAAWGKGNYATRKIGVRKVRVWRIK